MMEIDPYGPDRARTALYASLYVYGALWSIHSIELSLQNQSKQKRKKSMEEILSLNCQPAQCSGDQALGPNGSELAGAASDLSRSPRLTEVYQKKV